MIFQIIVVDDVKLKLNKERYGRAIDHERFCEEHISSKLKPEITVIDSKSGPRENYLTEKVDLIDTKLDMVYSSMKQESYIALVKIQLLREMSNSLISIETRISVEGNSFVEVHEAESFLNSTFKWNGYNVYGNKHYGMSYVTIKVGYKYKMCLDYIWTTVKVQVHAHTPLSTDVGGWNLNIHHVYNSRDGIVYKGDGELLQLDQHEKLVKVINENLSKTIISPVTVITDKKDNIYVGDLRYIRKIESNGKVTNLVHLNESTTNHKYYLTLTAGKRKFIIMSDPVNKRILRIPTTVPTGKTAENNFEVIISNNQDCNFYDNNCEGNNEDPQNANLIYPKGVAIIRGE